MSNHSPSEQLGDDVSWARRHLGAANPVPFPGRVTPPSPGLVATLVAVEATRAGEASQDTVRVVVPRARTHRTATVATALVGMAAMITAIVAAGVIGSGGSGGGVTRLASTQPVFAAASTTVAAKTAQVSLSATVGGTVADLQGLVDLATGNADFTAGLPAPIGTVELRTIGSVAYVQVPSNLQGLLGGKPWVKADVPTVEGLAGQELGLAGLGRGLDFTGLLDWLRGVSGAVTVVGTDTLHGDATTHYRADVDLAKAIANAPAGDRAKLAQTALAGQTLPVDVWIDQQGRLRQLKVSFDPSKLAVPATGSIKSLGTVAATFDLWNFGTAVNVTPPPADQIGDLTGVGGALKGLFGHTGASGHGSSLGGVTPPA